MPNIQEVLLLNGKAIGAFPSSGGGIRYDEENDVVQLYYNGQWVDWKSGGMAYPVGSVTEFLYTGQTEEFEVPASGLWKLEVWGGRGAYSSNGGYSCGYKVLTIGDPLYIAVGGDGLYSRDTKGGNYGGYVQGGWNGGGAAKRLDYGSAAGNGYSGSGGGATHIATHLISDGQLYQYAGNLPYVLIVAGGSGGGQYQSSDYGNQQSNIVGAAGGGTSGGNGGTSTYYSYGGSQTQGGTSYYGGEYNGSFGKGGSVPEGTINRAAGGGGGYYGGAAGGTQGYNAAGSGGSGYIGGVPTITVGGVEYTPTTLIGTQQGSSGTGKAKLTYLG